MNHPSELIDLVDDSKDENEIENGTNLMGTSISDEASKECIKRNDSDNDSNSGKQNRKRMRPTLTLPSTGLDVLLVGNQTCNAACHTLASAILRCNIDDDDNILHGSRKDEASVLKSRIDVDDVSSMRSCLKARHVQMTESLMLSPNVPSQSHPRADLIVVMVSARDPLCIETLQKSIKLIHRDYFLLGRTAFVLVHTHDKDKYAVAQDCVQSLLHARKVGWRRIFKEDFCKVSSVPVFNLHEEQDKSFKTIAKSIVKLSSMQSRRIPGISPLFLSVHL